MWNIEKWGSLSLHVSSKQHVILKLVKSFEKSHSQLLHSVCLFSVWLSELKQKKEQNKKRYHFIGFHFEMLDPLAALTSLHQSRQTVNKNLYNRWSGGVYRRISTPRPRCARSLRPAGGACAGGGGACVGTDGTCGSATLPSGGACPSPGRRHGCRRQRLPRADRCFQVGSRCLPVDSWCCSLN